MKFLQKNLLLMVLAFGVLYSCSQTQGIAPAAQKAVVQKQNFQFKANQRPNGTAFYSMNTTTGGLSYMLDYGENAGQWANYGNLIKEGEGNDLSLKVNETANGTIFYAMDTGTGQIYYMLDYTEYAGQWQKFGGIIRQNGLNMLQFEANFRGEGITFYAYDSFTHQTYFMNDAGEDKGKWQKFGTPYVAKK